MYEFVDAADAPTAQALADQRSEASRVEYEAALARIDAATRARISASTNTSTMPAATTTSTTADELIRQSRLAAGKRARATRDAAAAKAIADAAAEAAKKTKKR